MTYQELRREYPARVCICRPFLRDASSLRVLSWTCMETADTVDAARDALDLLDADGVMDAVLIPTSEELVIDGDLAARYARVFFGLG